ncbi:hypothetical protein [Aliihoeflea sp. PC F10.4]
MSEIEEKRTEMIQHVLAAKQLAREVNEQTVEFYLENTLVEVLGDGKASIAVRRLAVD